MSTILLTSFWLIIGTLTAFAQLPPEVPVVSSGAKLWCGSPAGLLEYNKETRSWRCLTAADGLAGDTVLDAIIDDNMLWVASRGGVAGADLRFLSWKSYGIAAGLPSPIVTSIAVDQDYVWAGTDKGVARFDKLTEQWENMGALDTLAAGAVNDLYSEEKYLWAATDQGVCRFDKNFEKWEHFTTTQGLAGNDAQRINPLGEELWVWTAQGFSRYDKKLQTWRSFATADGLASLVARQILSSGGRLWLLSDKNVDYYDPAVQTWKSFTATLKVNGQDLTGFTATKTAYWFGIPSGITRYNEDQNTWTSYTASDGLFAGPVRQAVSAGSDLVLTHDQALSFYDSEIDRWTTVDLQKFVQAANTKAAGWKLSVPDQGVRMETPLGTASTLTGLYTFRLRNEARFPEPLTGNMADYFFTQKYDHQLLNDKLDWRHKAALQMNTTLARNRQISLFYDNTVQDQEAYGTRYNGLDGDLWRRAQAGNRIQPDLTATEFLVPGIITGGKTTLEYGPASSIKKRRFLTLTGAAGQTQSRSKRAFLPYNPRNFYSLNSPGDIVPGSVRLWVDGDPVDAGQYIIERSTGIFFFKNEFTVGPGSTIEVRYDYEPSADAPGDPGTTAVTQGTMNLNDNISLNAAYLYHTQDETSATRLGSRPNELQAVSMGGEWEWKPTARDAYIRLTPELSFAQNDSVLVAKDGYATGITLLSRYQRFKLEGEGCMLSPNYSTLSDWHTAQGLLRQRTRVQAEYKVTDYLPLTAGIRHDRSAGGTEDKLQAAALFTRPAWPGLKLAWDRLAAATDTHSQQRHTLRLDGDYAVPRDLLPLNRLAFRTVLQGALTGRDHGVVPGFSKITSGMGGINLSPNTRLFLDAEYRVINQYQAPESTTNSDLLLGGDRLLWATSRYQFDQQLTLGDFSLYSPGLLPGVTLYAKAEGSVGDQALADTTDLFIDTSVVVTGTVADTTHDTTRSDVGSYFERRLTLSATLSPGTWWQPLGFLLFIGSAGLTDQDSVMFLDRHGPINLLRELGTTRNTFNKTGRSYRWESTVGLPEHLEYRSRIETAEDALRSTMLFNRNKYSNDLEWAPTPLTNLLNEYDYTIEHEQDTLIRTIQRAQVKLMRRMNERLKLEFSFGFERAGETADSTNRQYDRDSLFVSSNGVAYDSTITSLIDVDRTAHLTIGPQMLADYTMANRFYCREIRLRNTVSFSWANGTAHERLTNSTRTLQDQLVFGNKLDLDVRVNRFLNPKLTWLALYNLDRRLQRHDTLYYSLLVRLACVF